MFKTLEERREYDRNYRLSHKAQGLAREQRRVRVFKQKCLALTNGVCVICGLKYDGENAAAFQFHHRNADEKEFNISQAGERSWESVVEEVAKCDLVCSNCHSIIHGGKY